jgi:tetratricopeptide (TPR) repeat protein
MILRRFIYIAFASVILFSCKTSKDLSGGKKLSEKEETRLKEYFIDANRAKITGNYSDAISLLQKCLKIDEQNAAVNYELAYVFSNTGRDELALSYAVKAVEFDTKKNEWYLFLLATLYSKTGDFEKAAKTYKTLSKEYPYKVEYAFEHASALIYMNKLKDAADVYDEIESKTGINEDIIIQKERIWLKLGQIDRAIAEIEKLIKSNPREGRYYGMLAELYMSQGKKEKALETYNKLLAIDPNNAHIHISLAGYYREIGEKEKSFESLKKAFANPSLNIDTKVQVLLSYFVVTEKHKELTSQALELCKILTSAHPNEAKSHSVYGDFLYREKKPAEAREQYRKAISFDKDKFVIWNQILLISSDLSDFESMEKESKEAIDFFPNQPSFYFFHGIASIQLKNYEKAVESLETGKEMVVDNNPLLAQFYANLGDAYNALKKHSASDSAYENALKIEPENIYVLNNYSYFLSLREENLEHALEMSAITVEKEPNSPSFLDTYAWIFYKMKRYDEAKKWLEKAIEAGGADNGTILEHYGDALYNLKKTEEAVKYWIMAKEKGSKSELLDKKIAEKKLYE